MTLSRKAETRLGTRNKQQAGAIGKGISDKGYVVYQAGVKGGSSPIAGIELLSEKEWEVLGWIREGKSNWDISRILGVSQNTVKFHVKKILIKLNATNRAHATKITLEEEIRQKQALMKEMNHRIKNNLMILKSLINLQRGRHKGDNLNTALLETENRLNSVSLIHEMLSRSESSMVNIGDYLGRLCRKVANSYSLDSHSIITEIEIEDSSMHMNTAVLCGLIVNELLTNAFKYAFPDGRKGKVCVSLRKTSDHGDYLLSVKDNGVGLPDDTIIHKTETIGMRIVSSLARQMGGKICLLTEKGTELRITFKDIKK